MIKQLSFDEGEELKIRECSKLQKNISVDELKQLYEDEKILIVKSGKSYFDVTSKPEIFEKAGSFDIESLTAIDKRDFNTSEVTPVFNEGPQADPMDMLFQNTSAQEETNSPEEWERKSYYLRPEQVEAMRIICFKEHKEISELVRELLDTAIKEKSQLYGIDLLEEARISVAAKPRKKRKYTKKAK